MAITHPFTSAKADGVDTTLVRPTDWNADHVGTIGAAMHGTFTTGDLHQDYLLADGSRTGATSSAQDFGSNGIKADVIAESTGSAGIALSHDTRIVGNLGVAGASIVSSRMINVTGTHSAIEQILGGVFTYNGTSIDITGMDYFLSYENTAASNANVAALRGRLDVEASGATLDTAWGVLGQVKIEIGTVTEAAALVAAKPAEGLVNPARMIGLLVRDQVVRTSQPLTYGIRIDAQTTPASNDIYQIKEEGTVGFNVLAGNTRIGATTDPTVALDVTGDLDVSNFAAIGPGQGFIANSVLSVGRSDTMTATGAGINMDFGPTAGADNLDFNILLAGGLVTAIGRTGLDLTGLSFVPVVLGGTWDAITAINAQPALVASPVVTILRMIRVRGTVAPGASSGTVVGLDIADIGHVNFDTAVYGIRIVDLTASGAGVTRPISQEGATGENLFAAPTQFGASANIGFFATAPAAQASAYTQTYSTADKTHANPTAAAVGDLVATSGGWGYSTEANADKVHTAIDALIVDVADVKQLVNAIIDDLQAYGLFQ